MSCGMGDDALVLGAQASQGVGGGGHVLLYPLRPFYFLPSGIVRLIGVRSRPGLYPRPHALPTVCLFGIYFSLGPKLRALGARALDGCTWWLGGKEAVPGRGSPRATGLSKAGVWRALASDPEVQPLVLWLFGRRLGRPK